MQRPPYRRITVAGQVSRTCRASGVAARTTCTLRQDIRSVHRRSLRTIYRRSPPQHGSGSHDGTSPSPTTFPGQRDLQVQALANCDLTSSLTAALLSLFASPACACHRRLRLPRARPPCLGMCPRSLPQSQACVLPSYLKPIDPAPVSATFNWHKRPCA